MHSITKGLVAALFCATSVSAQQINNPPDGNHVFVVPWGSGGGFSGDDFGQSFTTPNGYNTLDQFTFQFGAFDGFNGANLQFRAYIAEFNTSSSPVGNIIFQSAVTQGTDSFLLVPYVFNTGGITVNAGSKYIAYVDASEFIAAGGGRAFMGSDYVNSNAPYAGGEFCYSGDINGSTHTATNTSWTCGKSDIAFTATFSEHDQVDASPEPATLALLGTGLIGVAGFARRRRRNG